MMTPYREKIILTYRFLLEMHEGLLARTINVGMTGEWAEVNKVFKVGDTYKFDIEQFRGTHDTNLNKLISFFDELESLVFLCRQTWSSNNKLVIAKNELHKKSPSIKERALKKSLKKLN